MDGLKLLEVIVYRMCVENEYATIARMSKRLNWSIGKTRRVMTKLSEAGYVYRVARGLYAVDLQKPIFTDARNGLIQMGLWQ